MSLFPETEPRTPGDSLLNPDVCLSATIKEIGPLCPLWEQVLIQDRQYRIPGKKSRPQYKVQGSFEWQSFEGRTLPWATISPCSGQWKMKVTIPKGSSWNASIHRKSQPTLFFLWRALCLRIVLSEQTHAEPKGSVWGLRGYSTDVKAIN